MYVLWTRSLDSTEDKIRLDIYQDEEQALDAMVESAKWQGYVRDIQDEDNYPEWEKKIRNDKRFFCWIWRRKDYKIFHWIEPWQANMSVNLDDDFWNSFANYEDEF